MMPGIVSISGSVGGLAGIFEPFAKLDFTTATYTLNGVSVALGDLLQRTDMTINSNGARFDWSTTDDPARFQAALIDAINLHAAAMTVVVECQMAASPSVTHQPINISGASDEADQSFIWLKMRSTYMEFAATMGTSYRNYYADYTSTFPINTTHRAALCYSPARSAGSALPKIAAFNGGLPTYSDGFTASSYTPAFTKGAIGGRPADSYPDMDGWIRKVEFYPLAMSEAELAAISSL